MSVRAPYLKIEEPINRGEFIEMLGETIVSYEISNGRGSLKIPDRRATKYKQYVLNIFFSEYVLGGMYVPKEVLLQNVVAELAKENHFMISQSLHMKDGKPHAFVLTKHKTDLIKRERFRQVQAMVRQLQSTFPCLKGKIEIAGLTNPEAGEQPKETIDDISEFSDLTNYYIKDLKNAPKAFWDEVDICVHDALGRVQDLYDEFAQKKFQDNRQHNPLEFAKSLYVYCQVLRHIEDVPKIAHRFVEMGKYMDGQQVKSMIMCYFNTDQMTGRNGKTYRMFGEENYLKSHGFATSNAGLKHNRIRDINVFKNHFFYKDEYAFKDTTSEFLKTINKNSNLKISGDVLYRGECVVENPAIFYLAAHNGQLNAKLESNERCLTAIRFSDARYEENVDNMTYVYDNYSEGAQTNLPDFEQRQAMHQPVAEYVSDLYLDLKTITMEQLFDGLLKCSKDITIPTKLLSATREVEVSESLSLDTNLMEFLQDNSSIGNNEMSFVRIYTRLAREKYHNNETAKQEVKKLYKFLDKYHPDLIYNQSAKNWDNKQINICSELLEIVEEATVNATADTDYSLIPQRELWLYILDMLGIDPNAKLPDLQQQAK